MISLNILLIFIFHLTTFTFFTSNNDSEPFPPSCVALNESTKVHTTCMPLSSSSFMVLLQVVTFGSRGPATTAPSPTARGILWSPWCCLTSKRIRRRGTKCPPPSPASWITSSAGSTSTRGALSRSTSPTRTPGVIRAPLEPGDPGLERRWGREGGCTWRVSRGHLFYSVDDMKTDHSGLKSLILLFFKIRIFIHGRLERPGSEMLSEV